MMESLKKKVKKLFASRSPKIFFFSIFYKLNIFKQTRCSLGRSTNLYVTDPKQCIGFNTLFFLH